LPFRSKITIIAQKKKAPPFSLLSGELYGFFYHDLFSSLSVVQFGGTYPWSSADELIVECPDRGNAVTIKLTKV
jgi:hypothetical protein